MKKYLTTFKTSKELKEAGVKQDSNWSWVKNPSSDAYTLLSISHPDGRTNLLAGGYELIAAFLTDELLEKLPDGYMILHNEGGYFCADLDEFIEPSWKGKQYNTPPEAAGEMLLWVIKNGYVK